MSDILIRDLPEAVLQHLVESADENGLSVEAEARRALVMNYGPATSPTDGSDGNGWMRAVDLIRRDLRAANNGTLPVGVVDEFLAEKRVRAAEELARLDRYLAKDWNSGDA